MKRFYQWGLLLLMGVLLAGCSLVKDGLKELTNENLPKAENAERKKDLATILLTQSKKEWRKWRDTVGNQAVNRKWRCQAKATSGKPLLRTPLIILIHSIMRWIWR